MKSNTNIDPKKQANDIIDRFGRQMQEKYAKGQREHGGNFFDKPTVNNIREEALDLIAYTHVIEDHKAEILKQLKKHRVKLDARILIDKLMLDVDKIIKLVEAL